MIRFAATALPRSLLSTESLFINYVTTFGHSCTRNFSSPTVYGGDDIRSSKLLQMHCISATSLNLPRRFVSSDNGEEEAKVTSFDEDEDDEDTDEDDETVEESTALLPLEKHDHLDYPVRFIQKDEEEGRLDLNPRYQRGYKWSQKRASSWIESILRGFPFIPGVTLIEVNDDSNAKYGVFDGKQRINSTLLFITNKRADHWRVTKKAGYSDGFRLEGLTIPQLKHLEGKTFQELPPEHQEKIRNLVVPCNVLPRSWPFSDMKNFFTRFQGGGMPMTDHELRRALSHGPFTQLLDELSDNPRVIQVFQSFHLKPDVRQEYLLRYFSFRNYSEKFCKPTIGDNLVETMKGMNREMGAWQSGESDQKAKTELIQPLLGSLELIMAISHEGEAFHRPKALIKKGVAVDSSKGVSAIWKSAKMPLKYIWDCTVRTFSRDEFLREASLIRVHAATIRHELIGLMQTKEVFTDSLSLPGNNERIHLFEEKVRSIIKDAKRENSKRQYIPPNVRKELIEEAKRSKKDCPLCCQPLGDHDDHLHIDHKKPVSNGGTNDRSNLQVVHRACNWHKSDKTEDGKKEGEHSGGLFDRFLE